MEKGHIVDPSQGIDCIGNLLITNGKITYLNTDPPSGRYLVLHADGMIVSPGFIDLHCHLRQPGFEEKETIASGTEAAARGGFTTVCCMPNTHPPIDRKSVVDYVKLLAITDGIVRVLPIGCISKGRSGRSLSDMVELAEAGVVAFSDDGSPVSNLELMQEALSCARALNLPIIEHCEELDLSADGMINDGWVAAALGLKGIPCAAEEVAVERAITLAELAGARLHIAHVSTAGSVELIRQAKRSGVAVSAEVTPHHLTLTEDIVINPVPYNTSAKVNPPLRTRDDNKALIQGLREGVIDAIATDHAPHAEADKIGEFESAAFGISGLETALGSLMKLVHNGELDLITMVSKLTREPARVIGLPALGTLKPGSPGDVTIFDPYAEWKVDSYWIASKGKNTPLTGQTLRGKVMATVYQGEVVYRDRPVQLEEKTG